MSEHVLFVPICPAVDSLEEQLLARGRPGDGSVSMTARWLQEQEIRLVSELARAGNLAELSGADLLGNGVLERLQGIAEAAEYELAPPRARVHHCRMSGRGKPSRGSEP